jgi:DNA-binding beta-propeller fold protein YncE
MQSRISSPWQDNGGPGNTAAQSETSIQAGEVSLRVGAIIAAAALAAVLGGPASAQTFEVVNRIAVPDARWDYAAVDGESRRLYLGRFGGVLSLDLASGQITSVLIPSALVHGVLPLGGGVVMSTNGEADSIDVFEGSSGRILARIPTGREPDAIAFEPGTGLVVTTNEGSRDLTLIDPVTGLIYIPAAKFAPPAKPGDYPAPISGTCEILVVGPVDAPKSAALILEDSIQGDKNGKR